MIIATLRTIGKGARIRLSSYGQTVISIALPVPYGDPTDIADRVLAFHGWQRVEGWRSRTGTWLAAVDREPRMN